MCVITDKKNLLDNLNAVVDSCPVEQRNVFVIHLVNVIAGSIVSAFQQFPTSFKDAYITMKKENSVMTKRQKPRSC